MPFREIISITPTIFAGASNAPVYDRYYADPTGDYVTDGIVLRYPGYGQIIHGEYGYYGANFDIYRRGFTSSQSPKFYRNNDTYYHYNISMEDDKPKLDSEKTIFFSGFYTEYPDATMAKSFKSPRSEFYSDLQIADLKYNVLIGNDVVRYQSDSFYLYLPNKTIIKGVHEDGPRIIDGRSSLAEAYDETEDCFFGIDKWMSVYDYTETINGIRFYDNRTDFSSFYSFLNNYYTTNYSQVVREVRMLKYLPNKQCLIFVITSDGQYHLHYATISLVNIHSPVYSIVSNTPMFTIDANSVNYSSSDMVWTNIARINNVLKVCHIFSYNSYRNNHVLIMTDDGFYYRQEPIIISTPYFDICNGYIVIEGTKLYAVVDIKTKKLHSVYHEYL